MKPKNVSTDTNFPTSVGSETQVVNTTMVGIEPQVENQTQNKSFRTSSAAKQDSSVEMEANSLEGLERGYTRIPNKILMLLASGELTRNEIRVVLLIARFTISFRREMAPLSKKVLERQSGLRGAAVLEAVSSLVTKGVVRKIQGDQHRPNLLGLVLPVNWENPTSKSEIPTGNTCATPTTVEKSTTGGTQDSTPFKDIKKYKTINSPSIVPNSLKSYFENLKPARKRNSEWRAFEILSEEYKTEDLESCVRHVQEHGIGTKKSTFTPCHSPFAYLSKAMTEVLKEVDRARKIRSVSENRFATSKKIEGEEREWQELKAREFSAMEASFLANFPTSEIQENIVEQMCRTIPFRPSPGVRRLYAIQKWYGERENTNQSIFATVGAV